VVRWTGVVLGLAAGLLYLVVGPDRADFDSHYPIAEAFLAGRLHLEQAYPWLELVPRDEGGWYSPFPPLLSVLLLPAAATGTLLDTNHLSALFGGISVWLVWEMLARLAVEVRVRLALALAWALGSQVLWVAGEGGQHLAPHMAAAALLLAALVLGLDGRFPLLAGLLLGAAAAARLPVGLALPLLAYLYLDRRGVLATTRPPALEDDVPDGTETTVQAEVADARRTRWRLGMVALVAGFAVPVALMGLYNLARFGDPTEFGYGLIRNVFGESVLEEPWYHDGIVSLSYLPQGLHTMLLRGFELQDDFPWIYGGLTGTSVLLTMPILWWVLSARGRTALVAGLTAVLVMIPSLLHGNPGFAQLGYRFILDALPILWLLLGIAFRERMPRPARVALAAGFLANGWLVFVHWSDLAVWT
jgi:hypothetical protein